MRARARAGHCLPALAAGLLPLPAAAHLPSSGLGPVYDGVLHLLLSPEDLIPLIGLALLCGQRGAPFARRALWVVPLAWFGGGALGLLAGPSHLAAFTSVSLLIFGGLVALNAPIPLALLTGLAVLFGGFHGYLNGAGISRFADGIYGLVGLAATACVIVAVFASLVIPLRRPWTRIAVRVAGSWIAASGLLLLGWALRGAR